ncbi:OmpP1/FadL family transporter [Psychromonas aquimarina]|uniref:OmpP1/FadL family transporter n=1 Tax=Psychromonas aquimarina TaxID=444919 RepID=UPI0003FB5C99|nr:outer membrane protein transport protein [Psychromonas aquimarina]
MPKTFKLSLLTLAGLTAAAPSFAGGLALSQIGTAESVATAGVAGVTNNRDSSAVISNPAGLSGIEHNSTVLGVQYLNSESEFERNLGSGTTAKSDQFLPHLSFAQRINENWVAGLSVHSPGGLGVEYSNGLTGGVNGASLVDENSIEMLNLTASASYQVNQQLALGASIIAQYASVSTEFSAGQEQGDIDADNWSPSFALGAVYQASDATHLGLTYNYGGKHKLDLDTAITGLNEQDLNWPQSIEAGLQHQVNQDLALMLSANWRQWSRLGDDFKDTYGAGIAMSYQMSDWTVQTGFSIDSSPLNSKDRGHALPLDQQWRLGVGGTKTLSNGMGLGLAYQYQSLGDGDITGSLLNKGHYDTNRVHFITGSLSF